MKWTSEKTEEVVKNEQPRETSNIWHKTQKDDKKKSHYGFPPPKNKHWRELRCSQRVSIPYFLY
jgi:hypothetical protein